MTICSSSIGSASPPWSRPRDPVLRRPGCWRRKRRRQPVLSPENREIGAAFCGLEEKIVEREKERERVLVLGNLFCLVASGFKRGNFLAFFFFFEKFVGRYYTIYSLSFSVGMFANEPQF